MRIVFMGTPEFAVPSLKKLVEKGYEVVAVISAPDRPKGRGLAMAASPVKSYAASMGLHVLQPNNLKDPDFLTELSFLNADLQIIVAFRMLPEVVWSMPPLGTFNLHASLLPQYRGAAPINWAIINGEKETGVTTFFLQHQIDTGDILFQERESIYSDDTAGTISERLSERGADLVVRTVEAIEQGDIYPQKQDWKGELKPAPKIFRNDCKIDWNKTTTEVINFIRGMSPYPGAWTEIEGKVVKIFLAKAGEGRPDLKPGSLSTDNKNYLVIGTADGAVEVEELQIEGKKRMKMEELLRGYKFKDQ